MCIYMGRAPWRLRSHIHTADISSVVGFAQNIHCLEGKKKNEGDGLYSKETRIQCTEKNCAKEIYLKYKTKTRLDGPVASSYVHSESRFEPVLCSSTCLACKRLLGSVQVSPAIRTL